MRDGRSAYASYALYHASFVKDKPQSLLGLIVGADFYGDWSEHYRRWTRSTNPLLVLRYEDLIKPDERMIGQIATFLGRVTPPQDWTNPFAQLNRENPDFFREAHAGWQGSDDWTELVDAMFFHCHGSLMVELGYATPPEVDAAVSRLTPETRQLLDIGRRLVLDLRESRQVCEERQVVIGRLKRDCDERLALIEDLSARLESGQPSMTGVRA